MDFNTFLENFDVIAEAPGGIPKLRSLILDLAVRGKLVPQNSKDEPAEKLLKVIFNKHIAFRKKFRKPKDLPPIENIDKPFELPYGWCWCRFTEIGQLERGRSKHRPRNEPALYKDGSIPLVQTGDVARANGLITTYTALYNEKGLAQSRLWSKGTLCITIAANIADSAILGFDACFPDSIVGFLPTEPISDSRYFEFFIRTLKSHLEDFAPSTAQKNINLAILDEVLIPLPPLAEQKRIVEKVDELMGLCDRYEAAKQTRDNLRQKLRGSAIASLMNAETDEELGAAWIFVRDNWHNVSQHPEDIDSLRQTLLHLAVRGKLVPQNPDDEPAEKLLEVIATKHASYAKKFREPKDLPSLKDVDKPFELPFGWSWCRFTEIGQLDRGKSKHRPRNDSVLYENGSIPLVQTGDVARANGVIETYTALYNNQGLAQSRLWSKGTLCITIAANIGDSAILGFDACFPDSIVGFLPTKPIPDSRYFEFFIRTLKSRLEDFAPSTAQKNINLGILDEVLIPLPPLAEQKRIVAKVDELMQLCDQLEVSLRQSQQRAESLAASAISHLTI